MENLIRFKQNESSSLYQKLFYNFPVAFFFSFEKLTIITPTKITSKARICCDVIFSPAINQPRKDCN